MATNYIITCLIPDQCYFYWDGVTWTEVAEQAKKLRLAEAVKVYKKHAHLRTGMQERYTVRLVDTSLETFVVVRQREGRLET